MKSILSILLTILIANANAQEVDSTFITNTYMPGFIKDTGKVLPSIVLTDINDNKKSINAFKDKILYIDIWKTWCSPCIGSFPYSNQLIKRLKEIKLDSSISVITICAGDNINDWKSLLQKHKPESENYYSSLSDIILNIDEFPTYLLVDGSGKIMASDATSPLETGLTDYILFAATKGIKPAESIWTFIKQTHYYQKNKQFTNDQIGLEFSKWYKSVLNSLVDYSKWEETQTKKDSR